MGAFFNMFSEFPFFLTDTFILTSNETDPEGHLVMQSYHLLTGSSPPCQSLFILRLNCRHLSWQVRLVQNKAIQIVRLPKFFHNTSCLRFIHWLHLSLIRHKTLHNAAANPLTLLDWFQGKHASRLFTVLPPSCWNEQDVQIAESLIIFK